MTNQYKENVKSLNIENYSEQKAKGFITLGKVGNAVMLVKAQWNVDTGESIDPVILPISSKILQEQIDEKNKMIVDVQKEIALLEELKTDILEKENSSS
jgi:hypothetical protein